VASSTLTTKKKLHRHHHRHRSGETTTEKAVAQKLIEYRPMTRDGGASSEEGSGEGTGQPQSHQMVVYRPRADLFLGFVNKGPESERGCSINKALKRFHRERMESGTSMPKSIEEKELWRSLRMRKNERGEIVLFSL